jgi:exonuclease VII small subunit
MEREQKKMLLAPRHGEDIEKECATALAEMEQKVRSMMPDVEDIRKRLADT